MGAVEEIEKEKSWREQSQKSRGAERMEDIVTVAPVRAKR